MAEEYSRQAPSRPEPHRQRARGSGSSKKPVVGMQVVAVQGISCAVILLLALIIRLVGGSAFAQLQAQFEASILDNSFITTLAALLESPYEEEPDASQTTSTEPSDTTAASATTTPTTTPSEPVDAAAVRYAPSGAAVTALKSNRVAVAPLTSGVVSSGFGYRESPTQGGEEFHRGVDIAAPEGTPVAAMYYGTVLEAGENDSYGRYVRIDHGNGLEVLYAHCSVLLVSPGTVVRAGEIVARVGATGDVTGSHLHVETRGNGIAYDPSGIVPLERYA